MGNTYEKRIAALAKCFGSRSDKVGIVIPKGNKWTAKKGGAFRVFRSKKAACSFLSICEVVIIIDV